MTKDQKSFAELVANAKRLQKMEDGTIKAGYVSLPPSGKYGTSKIPDATNRKVCVNRGCDKHKVPDLNSFICVNW